MTTVRHINCGTLHVPPYGTAVCHCLLLEDPAGLALVDTGIGLKDVQDPDGRLGRPLIELAGFQFQESDTAIRRLEGLGYQAGDVRQVVLTHADPDHTGGLADFPNADVHLSDEESRNLGSGNVRYVASHFEHRPRWRLHATSSVRWFGLEARPLDLGLSTEVLLVPLFGHTLGHCGVAVRQGERWLLHAGDAYYLRPELATDDHPVSQLAALRADDNGARRASLDAIRRLCRDHSQEVEIFGYHDPEELP